MISSIIASMNLEELKKKKDECRSWKNVEPWYKKLQNAQKIEKNDLFIDYGDWFSVGKKEDLTQDELDIAWDKYIAPLLTEYLRSVVEQHEIPKKLEDAQKIFKLK